MSEIVYLDICCFKRPFDDASAERVRREAEAVATLMDAVAGGQLQLVRSPAHDIENERNPREDRRLATLLWLKAATVRVSISQQSTDRAAALATAGFTPLDALHLAFAEEANARWFATTDDRLLKRAKNQQGNLRVEVVRPDEIPHVVQGDTE